MFLPTNADFIFTSETTPAVSTNLKQSVDMVLPIVGVADAVNVTDSPNSKTRLSSLLVAAGIKELGLDVILQLTGRDRNRIAIESEVLGALSLGINKVLCLTGDKPSEGGPQVVNEFDNSKDTVTEDSYVRAEFTSNFLRFVDDVEFYFPETTVNNTAIHVRSGARVGYSDLGVNRERVEQLRMKFNALKK